MSVALRDGATRQQEGVMFDTTFQKFYMKRIVLDGNTKASYLDGQETLGTVPFQSKRINFPV